MLDRTDPPDPHRAGRRERQRRYRRRQQDGKVAVVVEVDGTVVAMLVRTRWLDGGESADRGAIGLAVGRMLRDAARR